MISGYSAIISGCFIVFDTLVSVFGCSIVTNFMSVMCHFSTVFVD